MKIVPIYKNKVLSLPAEAVEEKLASASQDELRVLLSVFLDPEFEVPERAAVLDMTENAFVRALAAWQDAGVFRAESKNAAVRTRVKKKDDGQVSMTVEVPEPIKKEKKRTPIRTTLPVYSADELSGLVEGGGQYRELIDSCQQILGKIFNTGEAAIIVGLADHLALTPDYILLLCSYAAGMGKRSVRYVEKTAIEFYDNDISTYQELEDELKRREERNSMEGFVRELFGIGRRATIKKEREFIENWACRYHFSRELIRKAFEITVAKTHEANMNYTNAILENWYAAGLNTPEDVDGAEEEHSKQRDNRPPGTSFNTDDFFEAALRRSYGDTKKEGEGA